VGILIDIAVRKVVADDMQARLALLEALRRQPDPGKVAV
jgi:hypothetical protein